MYKPIRLYSIIACGLLFAGGAVQAAPVGYTNEDTFLSDLTALGYTEQLQEGFEDDAIWGSVRSTVSGGTNTAPSITSRGITWTSNDVTSEITTGPLARTGLWGFYSSPHGGDDGTADGFVLTSTVTINAAGGWITSNTGGARVNFILDGDEAGAVDFDGNNVVGGPHKFFGVIDTAGFAALEVRETEGTTLDQEFIFSDDFTLAGNVQFVPLPASLPLLGAALFVIGLLGRGRRT